MYEQFERYEEFAKLYQALILFQARALTHTMSGENTEERLERARFVNGLIEKANKKLDRRFPKMEMLKMSRECGDGLVNCHGVCIDPNGCWDLVAAKKEPISK